MKLNVLGQGTKALWQSDEWPFEKESEWDAGNVGSLVAVKECFCDSLLTTLQNVITVIWLILYIGHF